jgi:hypothetical protein
VNFGHLLSRHPENRNLNRSCLDVVTLEPVRALRWEVATLRPW